MSAVIAFFLGSLLGSLTTAVVVGASQAEKCDECRRREPEEGGGYHIGSHKELF